jgi:hypothetical protein
MFAFNFYKNDLFYVERCILSSRMCMLNPSTVGVMPCLYVRPVISEQKRMGKQDCILNLVPSAFLAHYKWLSRNKPFIMLEAG